MLCVKMAEAGVVARRRLHTSSNQDATIPRNFAKKNKTETRGSRFTWASFLNNLYPGMPAIGDIRRRADDGEMQQPTCKELMVEMADSRDLHVHCVSP